MRKGGKGGYCTKTGTTLQCHRCGLIATVEDLEGCRVFGSHSEIPGIGENGVPMKYQGVTSGTVEI